MRRIYIAATGAGAGAQADIWRVPGCSSYFAGATFPYGQDQLTDFLGFTPEQFCSNDTAIEMATAAYYRAWVPGADAVGVGLSAAVASAKPRRGGNRIHAAVMTAEGVRSYVYILAQGCGAAERERHGAAADKVIAAMIDTPEQFGEYNARAAELFFARPYWSTQGYRSALPEGSRTLYPGAFNPPHQGHTQIAEATGAVFWVEGTTPHKPPLTLPELVQRAKLLHGRDRLFTCGYPLYLDKSNAFPRRPFVIGADAFVRMLDPKWGPDPLELLRKLSENETRLLIVGRKVNGRFMTADEAIASVPESGTLYDLRPLLGRWDISSSELRNGDT